MRFKRLENQETKNVLQCNDLNNDIIFRKYLVKNNKSFFIKQGQVLLLLNKGNILDFEENVGTYIIENGRNDKKIFEKEWKNIKIRNADNTGLSVIFLNKAIIKRNKYILQEKMKFNYITNEVKKYNIKIIGKFDFCIISINNFFKKVVGLRNHYSKQELIEQIRIYILSSIKMEILNKNEININELKDKVNEINEKKNQNVFDKKLYEYGVKITTFTIENIEFESNKYRILKRK